MPIYEFYCHVCNTVYNFFSKSVNTEKIPYCPRCKDVTLTRQMSIFANISRKTGDDDNYTMPPIDEATFEKAVSMLACDVENMNEDDPRQAAQLMRKLSDATGLQMGPAMEEALNRMEQGEDPDKIEQEIGDLLEGEEPFILESKAKTGGERTRPRIDETLYDL